MFRIPLLVLGLVVALVASAPSSGMATATKLQGTVGPGFTITLKKGGKKVRTLKHGKYTITIKDQSDEHNFRLKGPGLNKQIAGVSFEGTKTVTVTLKKGTYMYVCDPHASVMKGSFRVT